MMIIVRFYSNGQFAYQSKDNLINYLVENTPNPEHLQGEERLIKFDSYISKLKHWQI